MWALYPHYAGEQKHPHVATGADPTPKAPSTTVCGQETECACESQCWGNTDSAEAMRSHLLLHEHGGLRGGT